MPKKMMDEKQTPLLKQLDDYFTPTTYNLPARTCMPTVTKPFEIKHSLFKCSCCFMG